MVGGGIVLDMVYMVREECKDFQGQMEIYGCHLGFDLLLVVSFGPRSPSFFTDIPLFLLMLAWTNVCFLYRSRKKVVIG